MTELKPTNSKWKTFLRYKKLIDKKKQLEAEINEIKHDLYSTFDQEGTNQFVVGKYDFVRQERVSVRLADYDTVEEVLSHYGISDNFKKVVFDESKLEQAIRDKVLPESVIEKLAVKSKSYALTVRPKKVVDETDDASGYDL